MHVRTLDSKKVRRKRTPHVKAERGDRVDRLSVDFSKATTQKKDALSKSVTRELTEDASKVGSRRQCHARPEEGEGRGTYEMSKTMAILHRAFLVRKRGR